MLVKVIDLEFTCKCHVACQCDDFHTRCTNKECHVKANLVVSGTCRAMSNGIGTNLIGIACNCQGLEDSLR